MFRRIAAEVGDLVAEKNVAYGNAFETVNDALRLLYPNGVAPEQYGDALALVRIWDKMMRIATDKDAFGESPYRDIAGYGLLGTARVERRRSTRHGIDQTQLPSWTCPKCGDVNAHSSLRCDCGALAPMRPAAGLPE
jgi:hypothetical protein